MPVDLNKESSQKSQERDAIRDTYKTKGQYNADKNVKQVVYACVKISKKMKPYGVKFLRNNKPVYTAVAEKLIKPSKFIVTNIETSKVEAYIKIFDRRKTYEAVMNNGKQNCVCVTKFSYKEDEENDLRHVEFVAFDDNLKETHHLFEKPPMKGKDGRMTLYFGGKIVIPSEMNCILRIPSSNEEIVGLRLIADNTVEIDTNTSLTTLQVLTFALGSMYL